MGQLFSKLLRRRMTSDAVRIYRRYYGFQLFFNLILWVPVFYEVQRRLGLSDQQIFSIQSVYHLIFCFFEIPTGFFADRFGYHRSLALGAACFVGANLLVIFQPDALGFSLHFMAISLSRSLVSGAASAWLYDYMRESGDEARYKIIEGRARSLGLIAKVLCWSVVGYLVNLNLMLPYWLTAAAGVLAFVYARSLPRVDGQRDPKKPLPWQGGLRLMVRNGLMAVRAQQAAWLVVGQGLTLFVVARVIQVNLYQPLLAFKGFAVTSYGAIMAAMTLIEAFGNSQAGMMRRLGSERRSIVLLNMLIAVTLLVVAFAKGIFVIGGFLLFSLAAGLIFPLQKQMLNDVLVPGGSRATFLSLESIVDRMVSAAVLMPMGALVARGQFQTLLVATAVGSVTLTLLLARRVSRAGVAPS